LLDSVAGGCGVASALDVAPVARLAGVLQLLARAEPILGCDRQLVVPLATEAGLLDAFYARLPPMPPCELDMHG